MRNVMRSLRGPRQMALMGMAGLILAMGAAACGSSTAADTSKLTSAHTSGAPADVVLAAVTKSADSDTVQLKMTMSLQGTGAGNQDVTGTGAVDFGQKAAQLDLQVMGMDMQMVTADNSVYVKADVLGNGWYRLDGQSLGGGATGDLFASGFIDPAQQFTLLKDAASNVTEVGTEQVNGESTTHYTATIDVAKAAAKEGATSQQVQKLSDAGISTVPVDVWVDGQGRIARLSLSYAGASNSAGPLSGATLKATIDYLDYGQPVTIQVPDASQVKDFSQSAVGQLLGGGKATQ